MERWPGVHRDRSGLLEAHEKDSSVRLYLDLKSRGGRQNDQALDL